MSAETSVRWGLNVFKMNISWVSISREDPSCGCEVGGGGGLATPWWVMTCEMEMNILYRLKWRGFITAIRIKSSSLAAVGLVLNMQEEHLFSLKINDASYPTAPPHESGPVLWSLQKISRYCPKFTHSRGAFNSCLDVTSLILLSNVTCMCLQVVHTDYPTASVRCLACSP